ncbi:hypothetical protein EWM64_g5161 [Hericium alpestre]|uniref:F-box domain-containing protein n=1 Tax=Hericium alpestre TaxID=135208 RepID=A0A4Y9ZXE5_9AGAM|nr:hypothetical protein EWM64_g5161 [Hericium alpestre]
MLASLAITAPLDFPSLRHLEWAAYNFCEAATLLHGLHTGGRSREFESLTIRRDRGPFRPENSELDVLLDALRTTCSTQALSSLTLWVGYNREPTIGPASSLLRPLFSFSRIEALTIWGVPVEYDDAFLDVVSTAWARLRVLRLHAQVPSQSKITPRGLLPLARQNRHLEELEVDVNSWPDEMLLLPATHGPADTDRQRAMLYVDIRNVLAAQDHSEVDECEKHGAARTQLVRRIFPNAYVHYKYELMRQ